jgi:putative Holliday junction resolvase
MSIYPEKTPIVSHFLALDYGKSRVGLAVADSETRIAFALTTLENDKKFLENLKKIVVTEEIEKIIIGKLDFAGGQAKAFEADEIGQQLEKELGIAVEYQEEMFSTKMAEAGLKERGGKKIKELDNQEAARIILQSWLDKNRKSSYESHVS